MHRTFFLAFFLLFLACSAWAKPSCNSSVNSSYEMGICLDKKLAELDVELNRVYQRAVAQSKEEDSSVRSRVSVEAALRTAQRAWLVWRDKECAWVAAQFMGGSGTINAVTSCMIELTTDRITALKGE